MVKELRIVLEDAEHINLLELKKKRTWKQVLYQGLGLEAPKRTRRTKVATVEVTPVEKPKEPENIVIE